MNECIALGQTCTCRGVYRVQTMENDAPFQSWEGLINDRATWKGGIIRNTDSDQSWGDLLCGSWGDRRPCVHVHVAR